MGVPGCPDLACWTASIESVRIVLTHNRSISAFVISGAACVVLIVFSLLIHCFYDSRSSRWPCVACTLTIATNRGLDGFRTCAVFQPHARRLLPAPGKPLLPGGAGDAGLD